MNSSLGSEPPTKTPSNHFLIKLMLQTKAGQLKGNSKNSMLVQENSKCHKIVIQLGSTRTLALRIKLPETHQLHTITV